MMDTRNIPEPILNGLLRYAAYRRPTGHFLRAALENNLREAVLRADASSLAALRDIVLFIYNEMPFDCHGSREAVHAWLNSGIEQRDNLREQKRKEA